MFFEAVIQSMSKKSKIHMTPKVKLEVSKQNVVFKATKVWNKLLVMLLKEMNLQILALLF